jgi:hypothetical protein
MRALQRATRNRYLKDFLESLVQAQLAGSLPLPASPHRRSLVVQGLGAPRGSHTVVPTDQVLYLFAGHDPKQGFVAAEWIRDPAVRQGHVYLRTFKGRFVARFPSLGEVEGQLDSSRFLRIHRSIMVNVHKIVELDLGGSRKRVAVAVIQDGREQKEWLTVARRRLPALLKALGLSRRLSPRGSTNRTQPTGKRAQRTVLAPR